jgi:inorganic pyrophosphatase
MKTLIPFLLLPALFLASCDIIITEEGLERRLPPALDIDAKAIIEIPAGTLDKFELNKKSHEIEHEHKDGVPRVVQYLAYPANYGYIPNTLLAKEDGGDGDPLDVLVLGAAVEREAKLDIKIIGALRLLDRGEQDDKLIAVTRGTPFWKVNSMSQLNAEFPGISSIIDTWLTNYKGIDKMESQGFIEREAALQILELAKISSE